jgi:tRNA dimethylallyltransferase
MVKGLETAIHQFAKLQMTWFRGMEKKGTRINWIDGELPMEKKVEQVLSLLKE